MQQLSGQTHAFTERRDCLSQSAPSYGSATREWRNKPEASRSMGGHRLPCPYKLAATCPPSLPHPQPRQLAESESDTQTSWRGRQHTQIFERAHTARLQQRRRSLPASLPSACQIIRVELARRPRPVDRAPRSPFERVHLCLWWSRIVGTDNQRTSSKLLLRQREGTGWAGCGGIATAAANFSSATVQRISRGLVVAGRRLPSGFISAVGTAHNP